MAAELVLKFLPFVAVHPAKELRVVRWTGAIGDAVGPVLGEAVLFGEPFEAGVGDRQLHHHVWLCGLLVVPP